MALLTSRPQRPLPLSQLVLAMAALWLAPVGIGLLGLALTYGFGWLITSEAALGLWLSAYALLMSPLFSWIGWLIALPAVMLVLHRGWFGWASAALVGIAAGASAGALAETAIALPFGLVAILALRAVLGRLVPL